MTEKYAHQTGTDGVGPDLMLQCVTNTGEGSAVSDEITIRLQAHRQNIARYRALITTKLNELERTFIDRRIAEEETEVRRLTALARRRRIAEATGGLVPFDSAINADDWATQS
jgi:hypothetical protein